LLRLAAAYTPTSPARCTQSPIVVPAGIEQRPERPAHPGGGGARRSATDGNFQKRGGHDRRRRLGFLTRADLTSGA
jgi:hypothetical protein